MEFLGMFSGLKWQFFFLPFFLFTTSVWAVSSLVLVVKIIEPDSSSWQAQHAVAELTRYVKNMTGANVKIEKASAQKSNDFLLGANLTFMEKPAPKADVTFRLS